MGKGSPLVACALKTLTCPTWTICYYANMAEKIGDIELPDSDFLTVDRPDLTLYGIVEFDRGICEDTRENRNIIRSQGMKYRAIISDAAEVSGLIEAVTPEMSAGRARSILATNRDMLSDSRDLNSDYISGDDLLYDVNARALVPSWVIQYTIEYAERLEKMAANPTKHYRSKKTSAPGRCKYIKSDGVRCLQWWNGDEDNNGLCRTHLAYGARSTQAMIAIARDRVKQGTIGAVDTISDLMDNAASETVRLKAATEILDRANIRGGTDVNVEVTIDARQPVEILAERLNRLAADRQKMGAIEAKRAAEDAEIVDAEIVEDV